MGLANSLEEVVNTTNDQEEVILQFDDLDDEELDSYIMNETEFQYKNGLWHKVNATYLEELRLKEEKLAKEKEEGKPEKKKRKVARKKQTGGPSGSAGEAIEKMLQEKKISSKINYDVLKSLKAPSAGQSGDNISEPPSPASSGPLKRRRNSSVSSVSSHPDIPMPTAPTPKKISKVNVNVARRKKTSFTMPGQEEPKESEKQESSTPRKSDNNPNVSDEDYDDEEDDTLVEDNPNEVGVLQLLQQHRDDDDEAERYFGTGYDEEDY